MIKVLVYDLYLAVCLRVISRRELDLRTDTGVKLVLEVRDKLRSLIRDYSLRDSYIANYVKQEQRNQLLSCNRITYRDCDRAFS